jgi:23S rRNA (guanosine2251-2'-O)-methyltransferase
MKSKVNKDLYIICENVRSLYNVGSIFRTSDAIGVKKIYLGGFTGTPDNPRLDKTALGSQEFVPWEHRRQTWRIVDSLKKQGVTIVALEIVKGKSVDIKKFKPAFPMALVVGHEVDGISKALLKRADHIVHIPMQGMKHSLNVSVSQGIAGYVLLNK